MEFVFRYPFAPVRLWSGHMGGHVPVLGAKVVRLVKWDGTPARPSMRFAADIVGRGRRKEA